MIIMKEKSVWKDVLFLFILLLHMILILDF